MPRRIKTADITKVVIDSGHELSEWVHGDWDPGFRTAQAGPRQVNAFYDGPGEAAQLAALTSELRASGYHVHSTQQDRGGRRRLEVTRP
ncbi:hypothetical protein AB0M87_04650 [Streptomyces sp. NPDC051320]|uniref:hypothetical protein n=1 Tax=Streptomyces sp. NPDC051320 TaxID=3154644 RepID=UPI0034352E85